MIKIFFWCAIASGSFGADIVECYDLQNQCEDDLMPFECARCYEEEDMTICPAFGAQTHEVKNWQNIH